MNYILAAMITVLIAGAYHYGKRKGEEDFIRHVIVKNISKIDELEDELDVLDDKVFDVVVQLNELLNLGHDLSEYDQSDLIAVVKGEIIKELEWQKELNE